MAADFHPSVQTGMNAEEYKAARRRRRSPVDDKAKECDDGAKQSTGSKETRHSLNPLLNKILMPAALKFPPLNQSLHTVMNLS